MSDRIAFAPHTRPAAPPRVRPLLRVKPLPLAVAAAAVLLCSVGPPAGAGPDRFAAARPATSPAAPVEPGRRTAGYGGAGGVKLIWFTMTHCGPCQSIRPHVERMHADGLPVFKVDLDREPGFAAKYRVNSAPTFVLEVDGREVDRTVGVPGGDARGTAARLRDSLTAARTAHAAKLARARRAAEPRAAEPRAVAQTAPPRSPRPARPRREAAADVPLTLTGGREEKETGGGLFDWFKPKKDPAPKEKAIDDPFAAADPGAFADAGGFGGDPADPFADSFASAPATADDSADAPPAAPARDPMKTVTRIEVYNNEGLDFGSGTVIASRPGRAIVLTCGHLFRHYEPGGRIQVETFETGAARPHAATLIGFDLNSDTGLLAVDCPETVPASALAPPGIAPGDRVVSTGCDGGEAPTRQNHLVQRLPACAGPKNFACTGQPQQGRSGGGCFDARGRLVGVVWSRSENPPEGFYTAVEPVFALLDAHGLTALKPPAAATTAPPATQLAAAPAEEPAATGDGLFDDIGTPASTPAAETKTAGLSPEWESAGVTGGSVAAGGLGELDAATAAGAEITCIIRPLGGDAPTQIVVINRATARTLALLRGAGGGGEPVETSFRPPNVPPQSARRRRRRPGGGKRAGGAAPRSVCRPGGVRG